MHWLIIKPRSTVDPARTLNSFPLDWKIHRLVKNIHVCYTLQKALCQQSREVLGDFVPHAQQSQSNLCFCIYLKNFWVKSLLLKVTFALCLSRFWAFLPIIQLPVQQIGFLSGLEVCIWQETSLYRYQVRLFCREFSNKKDLSGIQIFTKRKLLLACKVIFILSDQVKHHRKARFCFQPLLLGFVCVLRLYLFSAYEINLSTLLLK